MLIIYDAIWVLNIQTEIVMKWCKDISVKSSLKDFLTYDYCAIILLALFLLMFVLPMLLFVCSDID